MPKENKLNPYLLFLISTLLLSAGLLMRSFPVLVFAGLAPLYAIADHARGENFWNKLELVGAALTISMFAARFRTEVLTPILVQSISLTLAFAAFTFTCQTLGPRIGKLPLLFFWLTIEYAFLKFHLGDSFVFLGDALQLKTEWLRWTHHTGYLGSSLWILTANLFLYRAFFQFGIRLGSLVVFFIVIAGPIVYSYSLQEEGLARTEMISFYEANFDEHLAVYHLHGEWVPRTAAWISVLIILYAFVKNNIRKK